MAGAAGSLGKRLVADVACLSRFCFRMTGEAQFFLRGQKQFAVIGGMSFMACKTSATIRYRFMWGFQRHVFIRMAIKTQGVARPGKQRRALGSMGVMTGITLALLKGRMLNMTTGLQLGFFMTLPAEVAALLGDSQRRLRSGGVVALYTIRFGHRFVGAGFQELGL
jgi:hypothetical protein